MSTQQISELVWKEYERGKAFNASIGLYDTVRQNEDFYLGKQWEGLIAPELEQPVLNFLKRAVNYYVSMLVCDDVTARCTIKGQPHEVSRLIELELSRVIERTGVKDMHRDMLRNAAVDGDGAFYLYFDTDSNEIAVENTDNTKIIFGNPYSSDVQSQPYILLVKRERLESVCARLAEGVELSVGENGLYGEQAGDKLVTVVTKLWKQNGTVHSVQVTRGCVIRDVADTMCRLYPVAYMCWDKVKNCYHGCSPITALIPNQIAVNRLMALAIHNEKMTAFPKILYDGAKIDRWTNRVGEAIAVNGNPNEAVAASFRAADMSGQVIALVKHIIDWTKELMGASDSALGSVRPDNTSAILALQKASAQPLELQKLAFYRFVEDYVRIAADIMRAYYGIRAVKTEKGEVLVDFGAMLDNGADTAVDVGSSSYWNELTELQTLDNLFTRGIVSDAVTYLEQLPDKYVRNKSALIEKIKSLPQTIAEKG